MSDRLGGEWLAELITMADKKAQIARAERLARMYGRPAEEQLVEFLAAIEGCHDYLESQEVQRIVGKACDDIRAALAAQEERHDDRD